MPSETASKRAKRLVSQLSEFQACDLELPAPTCLSIKHYLRSSKHCRAVEVPTGPDTALTINTDRKTVRKFILSQLEAQRLTSQEPSSSVFLSPLVHFILTCIPACPSPDNTVATLFHWQGFDSHRTFYVFAFVNDTVTMPSHRYTVQELLCLRDLGVSMSLADVPQKGEHQAIQSAPAGRLTGSESRSLSRLHKFRPYHAQQTGTVRIKADFPTAASSAGDVMFVRQQSRQHTEGGAGAEMEWRYRGRAGSEAASSAEPLSAPTGLSAQHSEGFQRFYKAVISPSHVRVTAGGRIVPNTRGTSPSSKRHKDVADESAHVKSGAPQVDDQPQHFPEGPFLTMPKAPAMPLFAYPPNPFYPPFPTSLPGMPLMPMPMGMGLPGGFPYHHPPPPANNASAPAQPDLAKPAAKENQQSSDHRNVSGMKPSNMDKPDDKPRRAPSDQFDHSKPFFINGQLVYPYPAAALPSHMPSGSHPPFPSGFVGHPGFPVAAFHNPLMGVPSLGVNQMLNSPLNFSAMPGSFPVPQASHNHGPPVPSNAATARSSSNVQQPPTAPPISSIRPSDISRKQIEMLRNSLKYHEDQLQYNRHQIDEREMEHTIQMLQSQIDRFEALNQSQLRFEESHYPKKEGKSSEASAPQGRAAERTSHATGSAAGSTKHASNSTRRSDSVRHKPYLRKKEPFFSLNPIEPPLLLSDPVKKSTLPSSAALAPPFEPQSLPSYSKATAGHGRSAAFQWDGPVVDDDSISNDAGGDATGSTAGQGNGHSSTSTGKRSDLGKPYLVGTLPPGIDPKKARDSDYVYERELTQDETRSRYLYWGKAPAFTRRGLPGFDGKDFYPPSPDMDTVNGSPPPPLLSRRVPMGDPNADHHTEAIPPKSVPFSRPQVSGHYSSSFVRERQKHVKVTLRRPDTGTAVKSQQENAKSPKAAGEQTTNGDHRSKAEPQTDHARTKFLQTVLKRNISSNSEVLPGALTSATAQGVLPQYSASYNSLMAASLNPIMNSSPMTLGRPSPGHSDEGSNVFLTPASRKIAENRPLPDSIGPASLEQQFQSVASLEGRHDTTLSPPWGTLKDH